MFPKEKLRGNIFGIAIGDSHKPWWNLQIFQKMMKMMAFDNRFYLLTP